MLVVWFLVAVALRFDHTRVGIARARNQHFIQFEQRTILSEDCYS